MFEIGDVLYKVRENNNIFERKRITMKDDDGLIWHRYDMPIRSFEIERYKVIGIIKFNIEGTVISCSDNYEFKNGDIEYSIVNLDSHTETIIYSFNYSKHGFFKEKSEAELRIKQIQDGIVHNPLIHDFA